MEIERDANSPTVEKRPLPKPLDVNKMKHDFDNFGKYLSLSLSQCSPLVCGVYFTSMAVFLLQIFIIFFFFWSRSPRILKQPQSVFEGAHFCRF